MNICEYAKNPEPARRLFPIATWVEIYQYANMLMCKHAKMHICEYAKKAARTSSQIVSDRNLGAMNKFANVQIYAQMLIYAKKLPERARRLFVIATCL